MIVFKKAKIFDKVYKAGEIISHFRKMTGEKKVKFVTEVWKSYGGQSEEFAFVIQGFIAFLSFRYGIVGDDDFFQDCFEHIFKAFEYYDESKANILTFIFSIIRKKVLSYYYKQKKDNNSDDDFSSIVGEYYDNEKDYDYRSSFRFLNLESFPLFDKEVNKVLYLDKLFYDKGRLTIDIEDKGHLLVSRKNCIIISLAYYLKFDPVLLFLLYDRLGDYLHYVLVMLNVDKLGQMRKISFLGANLYDFLQGKKEVILSKAFLSFVESNFSFDEGVIKIKRLEEGFN